MESACILYMSTIVRFIVYTMKSAFAFLQILHHLIIIFI